MQKYIHKINNKNMRNVKFKLFNEKRHSEGENPTVIKKKYVQWAYLVVKIINPKDNN